MALTEREELELLTLEKEKYLSQQQDINSIQTPETMRRNILERQIAQRPDIYKQAVQAMQQRFSPEGIKQSFSFPQEANIALKSLGGVTQRGIATIANPLIEMGRLPVSTMPQRMVKSAYQGIIGERLGEFGDIFRQANLPEPISIMGGLISEGILMGGLTTKARNLMKLESAYGKDISKNIIRQTTGLSPQAVEHGQKRGWNNILQKSNTNQSKVNIFTKRIRDNIDKIQDNNIKNYAMKLFGYRKKAIADKSILSKVDETIPRKLTLRIQEGLIEAKSQASKIYGDDYNALAEKVFQQSKQAGQPIGGIPVREFVFNLRNKLINNRIIDLQGNELAERISTLNPSENYMLALYKKTKDLISNPSIIGFDDLIKLRREMWGNVSGIKTGKGFTYNDRLILEMIDDLGQIMGQYSDDLANMNVKYTQFRQWFNPANSAFKPYKGKFATKSGENILRRYGSPNLSGTENELLQIIENNLPSSHKFIKELDKYSLSKKVPIMEYIEPNITGEGKLINIFKLKPEEFNWLKMIDDELPKNAKFLQDTMDWATTQEFLVKPTGGFFKELTLGPLKYGIRQGLKSGIPQFIGSKTGEIMNRINPLVIPPSVLRIISGRNTEKAE